MIVPNSGDIYRRARARLRRPQALGVTPPSSRTRRDVSARRPPRASAIFGIGLAAYWPQFDGLRERLEGYQREHRAAARRRWARRSSRQGSSTPPRPRAPQARALPAARADSSCMRLHGDLRDVVAGAPGRPGRGRAGRRCSTCSRRAALDYEGMTTGEWLANCSACCVPEIAGALTRAAASLHAPSRGRCSTAIPPGRRSANGSTPRARSQAFARARIGFLGHTYPGMLDMYSDFTQVHAQTGAHVEVLEIDDLVAARRGGRGIRDRAARRPRSARSSSWRTRATIPIAAEITPEVFSWSARVAVGLDRLVADFELDGLTYYYRGVGGNVAERISSALIIGQLAAHRTGCPRRRRGRPQDERRDAPARPARRRRLVHRVLRASTSTTASS